MKETLDSLSLGRLSLLQAENGYRYSLDPVLLARFVRVKRRARIVDLGTGSGILPLVLARLTDAVECVGIECQPQLASRAARNVELNSLGERVFIKKGDIRNIREICPVSSFDLVVSNPPYRQPSSGRMAPNDERAAARHELAGGMSDFIAAASWLLKSGGQFGVIYLAERLPELMVEMVSRGIEPKRLRMVHPRQGESAKMVLIEGRKGGRAGLRVENPLYIYKKSGEGRDYTEAILKMYDPF